MFSKRERLPREQFGTALKTSRRLSSPHFLILAPEGVAGYAVVIPKKVVRLSVTRHRLKRQILEALRSFPLPPALIVFPRSSASSVNYQDIKTEIGALLSKIKN
ncbi:MAG: ribonuclease P protein component [Candidatus Paceibacteria bacterium]